MYKKIRYATRKTMPYIRQILIEYVSFRVSSFKLAIGFGVLVATCFQFHYKMASEGLLI